MISNLWLYILLVVNISMLVYFSVVFYKHHRQRKKALHIIYARPLYKIFICVCLGIGLTANLPHSLIFLGVVLSLALATFAMDVLIQEDGVFFVNKLISWEGIKEIYDDFFALYIKTSSFFSRKGLLKIIWKIRQNDIHTLKSLHEKALTTRCT